jgi:single-stranded-DNA-specific exonuclease
MKDKKWIIGKDMTEKGMTIDIDSILTSLFTLRGFTSQKEIDAFLDPIAPLDLTPKDVGIDEGSLVVGTKRIIDAIANKESIVVYADYDADGVTAGAVMWEALYALGANIRPYIPHRADEGYGLSEKGISAVREQYNPSLIITVDHGITAHEKVAYAKRLGIDVVVTDHHVKPEKLPDCPIIHTTMLSGAGISWFVASSIVKQMDALEKGNLDDLISIAAIGTIADMVPLVGPNRSIAKYGLAALNKTWRVGLMDLIKEAGLTIGELGTYDISHVLAPRLNAMGRLVHAMDALRLLCTKDPAKAAALAITLGQTNKERQQLTTDTTLHATDSVKEDDRKKLLFLSHDSYNQGIIGLVAGKLVETYYKPAIVVARGETISKASARSVAGFNIVEAIRSCSDLLIDVGGHPMAAGFTVETKNLDALQKKLEQVVSETLDDALLVRSVKIDLSIPLQSVTENLWERIRGFEPFGFGNQEPVFATPGVNIVDVRLVGMEGKHLKLRMKDSASDMIIDAIAFSKGSMYGELKQGKPVDIVYTIDMNVWNGSRKIQLKIKEIKILSSTSENSTK